MTTTTETQRGFTLTRTLDAPRDLVFQAWTDPDHLHWFSIRRRRRLVRGPKSTSASAAPGGCA